ncbi:hypothetical protein VDGD_21480 [Verticillium dahliae]|nr:hypothetical protein VDGD_21480 [Verticillium dahliae]
MFHGILAAVLYLERGPSTARGRNGRALRRLHSAVPGLLSLGSKIDLKTVSMKTAVLFSISALSAYVVAAQAPLDAQCGG